MLGNLWVKDCAEPAKICLKEYSVEALDKEPAWAFEGLDYFTQPETRGLSQPHGVVDGEIVKVCSGKV